MKCSARRRNCADRRRRASHNAPRMESAQIKSLPLTVLRFSRAHFWEASLVMNDMNSLTHFCTNSLAATDNGQINYTAARTMAKLQQNSEKEETKFTFSADFCVRRKRRLHDAGCIGDG